jgi:flagellar assembly protein FliH
LIFHLAKTVALKEISQFPEETVRNIVKKSLENAQSEEKLNIRVNPLDFKFLEKLKDEPLSPLRQVQKLNFETGEEISRGGCVLETNYGVVDATIEKRLEKIFEVLTATTPTSKPTTAGS